MSLATRCPACSTVFRVVQDQLRVSEGWVRCGRCAEVFNAVEHLVEVPAGGGRPALPSPPDDEHAVEVPESREDTSPAMAFEHSPAIEIDDAPAPAGPASADPPGPPTAAKAAAPPGHALARPDLGITIDDDDRRGHRPAPQDGAESHAELAPSFLREESREDRWARPQARRALWAAGALLALVLCVQVALEYRNLLAARAPALAPALETLCAWTGCRIEPPRWIEAIVVDSSGLVRVEGTQTYRFSAVMRNRAELPLAMPALDLTLTDSRGQVIARRVLLASDLGSNSNAVAPRAEVPLQATLGVAPASGAVVAGYTIEFFYP